MPFHFGSSYKCPPESRNGSHLMTPLLCELETGKPLVLILIEVHSETLRTASFLTSLFYVHVVVWIRTAPTGSYIWMLSERHYWREIKKCVLIGESVSLEVFQKPKPGPMSFFSCCLWIWMQNAQLLHQHHVCQHAPMLPPWRQWT